MSCRCGLAACGKKLLSVLPYIGDDEDENSDADFEVYGNLFLDLTLQ